MIKKTEKKERRLSLRDLELDRDEAKAVKGGWGHVKVEDDLEVELESDYLKSFGPRPDQGAGDALAWNEGDITALETE